MKSSIVIQWYIGIVSELIVEKRLAVLVEAQ